MSFILRTKNFSILDGKKCYGYADGLRDNYVNGVHMGLTIDCSHKLKWAEEFESSELAQKHIERYECEMDWDILTYEEASDQ